MTVSLSAQDLPKVSPILSGGYIPGIIGVRDYANPGKDGLFLIDNNIFLNADKYYDRNGDNVNSLDILNQSIPVSVDISGYINSLMFIYASPKLKFLGNAQYMFIAAPNFTTASTGVGLGQLAGGKTIDGGASGFGDMTVAPLMLSWGSKKFDLTAGYLFYAPTGRYEPGGDDNVGLGYWSHDIQAAAYYYPLPEKAMAILVMPTFEWHGNVKDTDIKPGSRFILEYGISQYFTERFEITLQGGNAWQIGEDSGDDVYWDTSVKDQMSIFGGGLGYWIVPSVFYANAKYSTTYGNKQHFKANSIQIELLCSTGLLKKKNEK
jgi:hypothetical protein